jgi:predicted Zn-dependent protease
VLAVYVARREAMRIGREHTETGRNGFLGLAMAAAVLLTMVELLAADQQSGMDYGEGLEALSAGKWVEAEEAFGRAVEADTENPDYLTARGVTWALAQRPADAIKDLQRSLRMRADDWETKLWLGAAYYMSGDAATGSQYITHGPRAQPATKADTDYSTFVFNLGLGCWQCRQGGQAKIVLEGNSVEMSLQELQSRQFPRAAAMFASRRHAKAPPRLAEELLRRAQADVRNKQFAAALKDLDSLLTASPEDDNLLLLHAECLLTLGDYTGSRGEYTRVLTDRSASTTAYLGRALAAAHLADSTRAGNDLAVAERLGAKNVRTFRGQVEAALGGVKPREPAEALARLEKAARAGEEDARLPELALAVHQAVNARRLRYDEIYQERLRALEEARQAAPKDVDRLVNLADFLFAESNTPFEQVEPRSWPVYYRHVPQAVAKFGPDGQPLPAPPAQRTDREVARAEELVEEALKADPAHVRSLGLKGTILNSKGQYEEARDVLNRAVAQKGDDPVLLRERSVALQGVAHQNGLAAAALQMPSISTRDNGDGTSTTTTVYPSEADLARARELERQAAECHRQAVEDMTKAQKLSAGTALGAYYQGLIDYAYHDLKQAQTDFQQAVKLNSDFRDAWEQLAKVDWELGLPEEWAAAREGALKSIQTTAGPWLTVARQRIAETRFQGAREALATACRLDAADARAQTYEGVIEALNDRPKEALMRYRAALALEEARGRLHGRDLAASRQGPLAVEPQDIGLTLALRHAMGGLLFEGGQAERAGKLFQANMDFLCALAPEELATPVPQAVLPSTADDSAAVHPIETYAMLKVRAQAGLDFVKWVGLHSAPKDAALAATTFKRLVAQASVDTIKPEVLQAVMSLAMAELEVSVGNNAHALELLENAGATPQPLWQEMRKTEAAARRAGQAEELDQYRKEQDRRSQMSVADAQRERLLSDRRFFEQSRQGALDELNKPGLSDQDKQVLRGSLAQYDRMIQDIDKRLSQLDAGGK